MFSCCFLHNNYAYITDKAIFVLETALRIQTWVFFSLWVDHIFCYVKTNKSYKILITYWIRIKKCKSNLKIKMNDFVT